MFATDVQLVLVLLLVSCLLALSSASDTAVLDATTRDADDGCRAAADLMGTGWHPVRVSRNDAKPLFPLNMVDRRHMYIVFLPRDDNDCSVQGKSACNSYGGTYTATQDETSLLPTSLSFHSIYSTMKFCPKENVMTTEMAYHTALRRVTFYQITHNGDASNIPLQLEMMDEAESTILSFIPCVEPSLSNVDWIVGSIQNTSRNTGKVMTLNFGEDGILRGRTGCRKYEFRYQQNINDATLTIHVPPAWSPTSQEACNQGDFDQDYKYENAIEEEAALLEVLYEVMEYNIVLCEDRLVLRHEGSSAALINAQALHQCTDDPQWRMPERADGQWRGCKWVGQRPRNRCLRRGQDGRRAYVACPQACGDDSDWKTTQDRDCDWVKQRPDTRCRVRGTHTERGRGRAAFLSCAMACCEFNCARQYD